jgi:hypothetical protein
MMTMAAARKTGTGWQRTPTGSLFFAHRPKKEYATTCLLYGHRPCVVHKSTKSHSSSHLKAPGALRRRAAEHFQCRWGEPRPRHRIEGRSRGYWSEKKLGQTLATSERLVERRPICYSNYV